MKYFNYPDMISMCGGLPSSDYFPFDEVSFKTPFAPQFSEEETAITGVTHTSGKHDIPEGKSLYDLAVALNYGQSMGPPQLLRFLTEHTEVVHNPPYSDWDIILTAGSTSGLEMVLRMFANRGDYVITEEYSFSTAIETVRPMGLHLLGIKMDEHGMLPSSLDHVLSTWNPSARGGARKPFLVYTVPTGQNPTSATQPLSRRKALYAIFKKHDLTILEDEPYYFLQMDPYTSGHTHTVPKPFIPAPIDEFLSNIVPSYLSFDTSGRIVRLDSFSKTLAPGTRCGWITAPSQLITQLIRHSETSVQNPSGFAMVALYKLLEENWGHKGYLEWLMYMRAEYTRRRDIIVNACERHLPSSVASWEAPKAGMFHWIKIDITKHPAYTERSESSAALAQLLDIESRIFLRGVDKCVLLARGSAFRAEAGTDREVYMRTTFAAASAERLEMAVQRMGDALREEFGLEEQKNGNGEIVPGEEI